MALPATRPGWAPLRLAAAALLFPAAAGERLRGKIGGDKGGKELG